jgi:integrase
MFSKKWSVTVDSLGTGNLTFHAFTHSRITADRSRDQYCDDQQRMGHASPNVALAIYAHLFRNRDDRAAKAINDALAGLGNA